MMTKDDNDYDNDDNNYNNDNNNDNDNMVKTHHELWDYG